MKNVKTMITALLANCLFALMALADAPSVINVTAQQRYPWNGLVDISYEIVGDMTAGLPIGSEPFILVTATNLTDGTCYEADYSALSGDTGIKEGAHHLVWDLNAQGLELDSSDAVFTVSYVPVPLYCVIDLSAGANASKYPVSYLSDVPDGGWADEYKTTKLVLRRIWPGSIPTRNATITKSYYIGVFEVTQRQYELVMGTKPSYFNDTSLYAARPVEQVSYNMIRGSSNGAKWPMSSAVDASSFMGKVRARTGIDKFDLPTEAMWEYACRAGTTTDYNSGKNCSDQAMNEVGSYSGNGNVTRKVGSYLPNAWGLYDMHGNVSEWCLDWNGGKISGNDPVGPTSGSYRVLRGGSWAHDAANCTSSIRKRISPSDIDFVRGFRLVKNLSNSGDECNSEEAAWVKQSGVVLCSGESSSVEIDNRPVARQMGNNTWVYCRGVENGIEIVRAEIGQTDSALNMPAKIDNMDVVSIGQNAFAGCGNLLQVTISGDIGTLTVGGNAFDSTTEVVIGQKDGYYFGGWTNATGVIISDPFHSSTPVTVSPRWMNAGEEYEEHLIFFEDFERDAMEFELTTVGTFPNPASIQEGMGVDGSRGFGFGRSDATGSAWGNYMNTLTRNLNNRYFITKVAFDEMERYGNYGSKGYVIANLGENECHIGQYGRQPANDKIADSEFRHRDIEICQMATNISFQVSDITNASEEFIDNVKIYGRLARQCTFTFDANGGDGEMAAQTVIEGDSLKLAENGFSRIGYTFLGWSKTAYGDVAYEDCATIPNVTEDMERTTLYAAWKPIAPEVEPSDDIIFLNASQAVTLSHNAEDVVIFYTTDGSNPMVNGRKHKGTFAVYNSCTVRGVAYGAGRYSDEVSVSLTRADNLGAAANLYGCKMESGESAWVVDGEVSHNGVSSIKSNGDGSYVQTSVRGAGTLSFWWRAMCEEPEDGEYYDYGVFKVGSAEAAYIAGNDTGWVFFSTNIATTGKHILRWEYRKDDEGTFAPDCVWLDQVQWVPADGSGYTLTSPEPVPYSWLRQYNLGVASGDFEAAANAASGKMNWGRPTSIWEEFVAGLDPTNENSRFEAKIEMVDGAPVVTWEPNLNTNGIIRLYKVYGRESLTDGNWQYPTNSLHRFFRVDVDMP